MLLLSLPQNQNYNPARTLPAPLDILTGIRLVTNAPHSGNYLAVMLSPLRFIHIGRAGDKAKAPVRRKDADSGREQGHGASGKKVLATLLCMTDTNLRKKHPKTGKVLAKEKAASKDGYKFS
jgi:hypothetical protein